MPALYAIGDVHLSLSDPDKSMEVFGSRWGSYMQRLREGWLSCVTAEDTVLIPGDISWAMQTEKAAPDLEFLHSLPGTKVLLRGNHDYWWSSYSKVKSLLPSDIKAVQNNALVVNGVAVCGTRGWLNPMAGSFTENDRKLFEREKQRLRLSLNALPEGVPAVCMLHYPPFSEQGEPTDFAEIIAQYPQVTHTVYGHLHGKSCTGAFCGEYRGCVYALVSADYLGFIPQKILSVVDKSR